MSQIKFYNDEEKSLGLKFYSDKEKRPLSTRLRGLAVETREVKYLLEVTDYSVGIDYFMKGVADALEDIATELEKEE